MHHVIRVRNLSCRWRQPSLSFNDVISKNGISYVDIKSLYFNGYPGITPDLESKNQNVSIIFIQLLLQ